MKKISFILIFLPLILFGCKIPFKSVYKAGPSFNDFKNFENVVIEKGGQPFSFYETPEDERPDFFITDETHRVTLFKHLDETLEGHKNHAFIVIQNDSILYERYSKGFDVDSYHPSYSVAKSFTSALIGIAIDEGHIQDENELVTQYIPELNDKPEARTLTIKHLLSHTSGIPANLAVDAHLYYGKDIWKGVKQIKFQSLPGEIYYYSNLNTQLLGIVLKRATNVSNYEYLQEKIWKPLGMESDALWSVDNKNNLTKSYCCLSATARDYAKFGRLYLNEGKWEGQQIISKEWVKKSTARDASDGSSYNYGYSWQIGLKEYADFRAAGLYEQYIAVFPKKNLIILTFNDKEKRIKWKSLNWIEVFRQISDQL